MSERDDWVRAYARQADADFTAWELYERFPDAVSSECHRMQFLQMACEKLCKAYLLKSRSAAIDDVIKSHGFVKKHLSMILRQGLSQKKYYNAQIQRVQKQFNQFAHEIEVLSPAQDRDKRPDNCEYPWKQGSEIKSPLDWPFELSKLLTRKSGTTFLKSLRSAINHILGNSVT